MDHLDEIIEQLNESAQPDMAQLNHFTDARVAAIAANDSAISLIKTPNQAGVPSLSFDVTGNKLAELQAKAKTRFGLDDGAEAAHRLAQLTEHTQVIDSFSKLTYELMVAVDQHTTFVARKNQMTDSGRAAIDAIKALNAPDADALPASVADAHRVDLAIHWGGVFASHPNAAQWRPHTLDEKMARLVGAMRTVPDGALNDDPRFNDIRRSVRRLVREQHFRRSRFDGCRRQQRPHGVPARRKRLSVWW